MNARALAEALRELASHFAETAVTLVAGPPLLDGEGRECDAAQAARDVENDAALLRAAAQELDSPRTCPECAYDVGGLRLLCGRGIVRPALQNGRRDPAFGCTKIEAGA